MGGRLLFISISLGLLIWGYQKFILHPPQPAAHQASLPPDLVQALQLPTPPPAHRPARSNPHTLQQQARPRQITSP